MDEYQAPKNSGFESHYDISELFVSRTDQRGVITAGNGVFVRVSGYGAEDLLGSPHNIIRHPDMPKSVFKLLWDTIKSGKEIAAYVKNRARDGRYYWVLATVFPTQDSYLSIRLKPTSPLRETVDGIYRKVLEMENAKGIDAGFDLLVKMIREAGFPTYDDLMRTALKTELGARDEALLLSNANARPAKARNVREQLLNEMWDCAVNAAESLRESENLFGDLQDLREACGGKLLAIAPICERLESLAVNMFISAHKLGKDGSSLAIVANSFRGVTSQVCSLYELIKKNSEFVLRASGKVGIDISLARVQAEMLLFNIGELASEVRNGRNSPGGEEVHGHNEFALLLELVREYFLRQKKQVTAYHEALLKLRQDSEILHQFMVRLDLIRTGGKLEGFRSSETIEIFKPFVAEMSAHILAIDTPVSQLIRSLDAIEDSTARAITCANRMEYFNDLMGLSWNTFREKSHESNSVHAA